MPPVFAEAAGPLAAADAAALAAALAAVLAATLGAAEDVLPLHAAMTMPIALIESPRTVARWMNSRRLSRPAAYASTTSSWSGTADRRTLSYSE